MIKLSGKFADVKELSQLTFHSGAKKVCGSREPTQQVLQLLYEREQRFLGCHLEKPNEWICDDSRYTKQETVLSRHLD
jgi:hypothetical protein